MDMLTHIFSLFLPGVFTVLRTYILVTTVFRPINGYVDTFSFLPVVFTVLRTYILVTTVMGNYRPINGYGNEHTYFHLFYLSYLLY